MLSNTTEIYTKYIFSKILMCDGIILGQGCKWIGRYSKRIKIEKGVERENFRDREKSKYNKILCINTKKTIKKYNVLIIVRKH